MESQHKHTIDNKGINRSSKSETIQWPKEKGHKDKSYNDLQYIAQKTKDRIPIKS